MTVLNQNSTKLHRPRSNDLHKGAAMASLLREVPPDHPWPETATCPVTGMMIPKDPQANLMWRNQLRSEARDNPAIQQYLHSICAQSVYFWMNAFMWTYHQKEVDEHGHEVMVDGDLAIQPMITWPCQDEVIAALMDCIVTGQDANLEKSRDMGATWLVLGICDWFCTFRKNINPGCISRKEDLVDKNGDMDTLFEKIRFIHSHIPSWLRPRIKDRFMFMRYVDTGSTFSGESTNKNVGRGGRKAFYVVDEAAVIPNAKEVERALSQNTSCQIWISTPWDAGSYFYERIQSGRGKRLILPWYRHPTKGRGAYQIQSPEGKVTWTSPWKQDIDKRFSRQTVAREVEMDHGESGTSVFNLQELERHRLDHVKPPLFRGELEMLMIHNSDVRTQIKPENSVFQENMGKRRWRFWFNLEQGRPPQDDSYVFGVDISQGSGDSNSTLSVLSVKHKTIIAKFWDASISPEEFAELASRAGHWFGGNRLAALMVYENNGPGGVFGRKCQALRYPYFYRDRRDQTVDVKRSTRLGWHSSPQRKATLLGMYRDALATDQIIQHCAESIAEAAAYVFDTSGTPVPAALTREAHGGRALHGDHVIADALCLLGMEQWNLGGKRPTHSYAPGTIGFRKEKRRLKVRMEREMYG
jgi:hypothetical protein